MANALRERGEPGENERGRERERKRERDIERTEAAQISYTILFLRVKCKVLVSSKFCIQ